MKQNWLFIKKRKGNIVRAELYGSVRAMFEGEKIRLTRVLKRFRGGKPETYKVTEYITEYVLRSVLKQSNNKFINEDYHIEQKEVIRRKHSKN